MPSNATATASAVVRCRTVKQLAADVWQLDGRPADMVNTYLVGDVLIDAGTRYDAGRILKQLRDRDVTAHALTHAHPDHLGSSHAVCEKLGIPFWVGAGDADAAEDEEKLAASLRPAGADRLPFSLDPIVRLVLSASAGPAHPVARRLHEGDEVADFTVLETPGHSAGHVVYWRESDRTLIAGDVLWNFQFAGGKPGLTVPPSAVNFDSVMNRESARRLAALKPALICFGHGPALRDTQRFVDYILGLPTP
jgi:glyoxylase-like metal-dependent hydrolase (beta-lactamase superfamily II)